ncbi:hypothetical protein [Ilumatobacter coccineus]|uniref:CARDB domain-containing protein n=1 Tax=Ilumatobacter coccineus (strain NBRC 103263 / KCTC 29153 / YM16-304) TaxID=1313172 RepID=A0A6C7E7R2_ILUCY|nr:hypothetical protein [Ilumatobacter coccineus]BAN02521.1 hypothetical protein YM304_22070 [Ilumatobacter coccineus YM16-304]
MPSLRRHRSLGSTVVVAIAVLGAGACGSSAPSGDQVPAPAPTAMPSVTTLVPARTVLDEPLGSVDGPVVTEPCPESAADLTGGQDAMVAESSRLEPMLGQVMAYGGDHPDQFGTSGMIWHGAGDASVFASFTADLDVHRSALSDLVEFPDELIVCQTGASAVDVAAIEATLLDELAGRFLSIGRSARGLEVQLMAGEEDLAAELDARYGDAIILLVGELPYPIGDAESTCEPPPTQNELDGLDITIDPPAGPLDTTGLAALSLTATLTNTGDESISFGSGASQGVLLDLDGSVVSGRAAMTLEGIGVDLAPGESSQLPVVVSTASCDPALGSELPPGEYTLVARVQHSTGDGNAELTSTPTQITITN